MSYKKLIYQALENIVLSTTDAIALANEDKIEQVFKLIEQREEMLKVFDKIYQLGEKDFSDEFKNEVHEIVRRTMALSDDLNAILIEKKDKVQIEIAKVFKNKENFKGYNLNVIK